jgi:hypothetical protein
MWQHQPSVNFCEPYEQEHIRIIPKQDETSQNKLGLNT